MANEKRSEEGIQRDVLAELKWDARVLPNEIAVRDSVVSRKRCTQGDRADAC
jgi:hypothetical protein